MTPITDDLAGQIDRRIFHLKSVPYASRQEPEPVY
jgi:hypothetical protein